jgi:ferritin-like metal-binding protein YciE
VSVEAEAARVSVIDQQLVSHLMDAHAIEEQSLGLLRRARRANERGDLHRIYEEHLARAEEHRQLLEDRLRAHGAKPSALRDAAMRLGALNWGLILPAQPVTPGKATALAFALTHLKIAGYELLKRVAARAGDEATVAMADHVLADERAGAVRLSGSFDEAVDASIEVWEAPRSAVGELRRILAIGERERAEAARAAADRSGANEPAFAG